MRHRAAVVLLQIALVAIVLAVLPYKTFELDRYFVPKELVLHVTALLLALLVVVRARTQIVDTADLLLVAFLTWSILSALFATNYWVAQRAVGVSVSGAVVFWAARRLSADGWCRAILLGAATATVCAALTSLAQAYGIQTDFFSLNRVPGGTFGNRNFVAHICAIGLPALVFCAVTARRSTGAFLGAISVAMVAATLVLSRSRAAWLAMAASVAVMLLPLIASRSYWREAHIGGRLVRLAATAVAGGIIAVALPNRLNWSSESPYLDSARGMMDYSSGSGRGRVAQYMHSLRMAASHPVFGVGPGNWPVQYVQYVPDSDPSIGSDGMTANPWPSSDWAAFISERGIVATAALLGVFALLLLGGMRHWGQLSDPDSVLARVVLIGTITATLVVSLFDAVLLLAAPALLAWSVIGATSGVGRVGREVTIGKTQWTVMALVTLAVLGVSVARSVGQTLAIESVGMGGRTSGWVNAAMLDPGSYRINLRAAQLSSARGRCSSSRAYARQALSLFPHASAPRQYLRC